MVKKIILVSLLLMLPLVCLARSSAIPPAREYKKDLPSYPISRINKAHLAAGQYNTEGYVVFISICPPCPKGAVCETCLKDHLLVSETNQISNLTASRIREIDLVLFTGDLTQFKVGEKYKFSIEIPGKYSFDGKWMTSYQNEFRIIGYRLAE